MAYQRFVALGDSFTEGVGDPDPQRPNGVRGWADRVAETMAQHDPDFTYANLAIRGRKLPQIIEEQIEPAIAMKPDLITIHGGGNDILRPRIDVDALARSYDDAIARLRTTGAHVVMFTVFDPGPGGIYGPIRGRFALFNEFVREIADSRGVTLVDMWRMRDEDVAEVFDEDRMHLNAAGHRHIAHAVLQALDLPHEPEHAERHKLPVLGRRERWRANAQWSREYLGPWIHRRVTGRSSGDGLPPKHPTLTRPQR
ncbi:MAG: SGNH/GDSL hydrolase family protein [Nocardioides sp.]|jgi:lysophospholipase L1-like esterase